MTQPSSLPRRAGLATGLGLSLVAAAPAKPVSKRPPNIIIILADDLGWGELGSYGQAKIRTPHLDRMAAEGQRWTQFYSGAPVCAPSRNSLLTGRHTGGCNVQDLKRVDPKETADDLRGDWPMAADATTIHAALKKAGYATSAFGKWGMGEYGTSGAPDRHGIDHFFGYTDHRMCHTFYPPFLWRNGAKVAINTPGVPGHARQPEGEVRAEAYRGQVHASAAILDDLLAYLDARAAADKPFFMYYAPLEPHVALQPPQEWVDRYPAEWDPKPYRGETSYLPHPRPRAAYAATISYLDDQVGRVMAKLKEKGFDEDTLVVFTSDNGTTHDVGGVDHRFFDSVRGLKGLKGQMDEGGLRVPALMRWPKGIRPGVVDQPGYAADLLPTLCRLAGADAGQATGENLLPVVAGKRGALAKRRPMVWAGGGYGGQAAVRLGDMKAIRRNLFKGGKNPPKDWEVYDLAKDPKETTDLAATRRDVVRAAQAVLRREYRPDPAFRELDIFAPEGVRPPKAP
jgi:arylsulfatase A-like enzyme